MCEAKPNLPEGYLGKQPTFSEIRAEIVSHPSAQFELTQENEVEIKLRVPFPIKSTSNLIQARTDKEFPEYVFTQTQDDVVSFVIQFPEHGWYKFQIFALPASDEGKSLPNIFNYLINIHHALKAVYPFPKQYAPWRNGCYLYYPLILNSSSKLHDIRIKTLIPNAKQVAVVAAGDWYHLKPFGNNTWEGSASLDQHRNKNVKVTLSACMGEDETKFATLLEYVV